MFVSLSTLQYTAVLEHRPWLPRPFTFRILEVSLTLALRRRPPIVARKTLVPAPMPVGFHELGVRMHVAGRALPRGFGPAVRREISWFMLTPDPSQWAVGLEGGFALGVRDLGGFPLLEGCGFGELGLLFDGFDGLFSEFLLDAAGTFGASAGGIALWHGGCCAGGLE